MGLFFSMPILLLLFLTAAFRCLALSRDGLSLLAFKSAISADPSSALTSWSEDDDDPCRWTGISCANVTGFDTPRVVGIAVSGKNLTGYIPSELGELIFLRRLNLHGNRLSGSIPLQLFNASSLHSIFLYDNNLSGLLPPSLCRLPHLQKLDLSKNSLSGPIPPNLRNCRQLQRLLLAQNGFSGEIPAGVWPEMPSLVQLDLSSNQFNGSIPADVADLKSLGGTLNLSHNRFSGAIPSSLGKLPPAVSLDLRFNNLSGEIPQTGSLANQGPTAFLNNMGLCGFPLQNPCLAVSPVVPGRQIPAPVSDSQPSGEKSLSPSMIILISVADATGVTLVGLILIYAYWKLKDQDRVCSCTGQNKLGVGCEESHASCSCWRGAGGGGSEDEESEEKGEEGGEGELVAIDKGLNFELDELLRSSAYVLGKSGLGIVYKVVLTSGAPVAVRRLGSSAGGQRYREFSAEAQAVGRLRHPNVVRLLAYYWAQDEKLLITDFISNGNLATALRGRSGQPRLSWAIRLKIAKGAARGLSYIHECSPRKYVHGNIKPSNILLDGDYNSYVSDFGLIRLLNIACTDLSSSFGYLGGALPAAALEKPNSYKAPEARVAGAHPMQKWDVYSFGIVLLEMLTGKSPDFSSLAIASSSSSPLNGVAELARWVRRSFDEAKPLSELVNAELLCEVHAKKEVLAVLHLALACTEADPESRPRMKTVSDNLEKFGGRKA